MKKLPREGYIAKTVREFYLELKDAKHYDPSLKKALKLGKRCLDQLVDILLTILELTRL